MKRISIIESRNGYLIIDGDGHGYDESHKWAGRSWTFNSLDKAIGQIRTVLKGWREAADSADKTRKDPDVNEPDNPA